MIVDGSGPHKDTTGLKRVDIEFFIGQLMKRESKAAEVCQSMQDRIVSGGGALRDSKVRQMKIHRGQGN